MADFVAEAHDVHHPVGVSLYYEDQKPEASRRAKEFRDKRVPKFLGYFELIIERNATASGLMVGDEITYVDLSAFQIIAGLNYAFPKLMRRIQGQYPKLFALHERISKEPRIASYLKSKRRLPFNQEGIFRHYPELDA
jgi:glutathione S-transferase